MPVATNPVENISIPQGSDFSQTFVSKDSDGDLTDLTGYTGEAKLKKHAGSATNTAFSVTISASVGQVAIAMTSGVTTNLESGRYLYDVRLTSSSGAVSRLVEGMALVTAGIST